MKADERDDRGLRWMALACVVACTALVVTMVPAAARPGERVEGEVTGTLVAAVTDAPQVAARQRPARPPRPPRPPRVPVAPVAPRIASARPAAVPAPVAEAMPAERVGAAARPAVEAVPASDAAAPAVPVPFAQPVEPVAHGSSAVAPQSAPEPPIAVPPRPGGVQCPPGAARTRNVSINDGRGVRRAEWADSDCAIEVRIEGDVEFNEDFTGFASIAPGGLVRISERGSGTDRLLEIRPGAAGGLAYRYLVSGREAPFDAEARAWLEALIPEFLRNSSIAATERAVWLLRTQGVDGLLAEIPLLRGDRAQRVYLEAFLDAGPHSPQTLVRALDLAGAELSSDRELRLVLERIATRDLESARVRQSFLQTTTTLESDRELGSVLVNLMERESLSPSEVELVLESAGSIGSDRELAGVLLRVIEESRLEGVLRDRFMSAMETLESDRQYGRVASALLRAGSGG
jgi:hypothetical protein